MSINICWYITKINIIQFQPYNTFLNGAFRSLQLINNLLAIFGHVQVVFLTHRSEVSSLFNAVHADWLCSFLNLIQNQFVFGSTEK